MISRLMIRWMILALPILAGAPLSGQEPERAAADSRPDGLEFAGLPALGFNSDDGLIYGVLLEVYQYGDGLSRPYVYTIQPALELSTEGKRELRLFFDAPHLLPPGWRLDAYLASEEQVATPFYGLGNESGHDPSLEEEPNPYYYRFGRTRNQLRVNVQRELGVAALRLLAGGAVSHVSLDAVPFDSGTTLVADLVSSTSVPTGWWNSLRAGLVRDTRDREVGPRRGSWSELLVQHVPRWLGSEASYTRLTLADRRYWSLRPGLVLANRVLVQQVMGDAPFYELSTVESSFKQQEGLGGAKTVRGLPKNRYAGNGLLIWNLEARWRAAEFALAGRSFHVVLSGFADSGRVWMEESPGVDELFGELHTGYGGGVRLGMGESFVVAVDGGVSDGYGLALYIGLGYLF